MNATEYQKLAARTLIAAPDFEIGDGDMMILWNALGLAGEAGEVAELVKKGILHQHGLDPEKMRKELGDCLWYIAALCTKLELDMGAVMFANIEKLKLRYPDGFKSEDSIARVDVGDESLLQAYVGTGTTEDVLRDQIESRSPKRTPQLIEPGERIMCDCGDEQCYKAIEVGFDSITVYEDISDAYAGISVIELPEGVALVKYEDVKR